MIIIRNEVINLAGFNRNTDPNVCHGQGCRVFWGDKLIPPFIDGILIMGPYKPLRTWVDEFIPYYMEISWELSLDPIAHVTRSLGVAT